MIVDSLYLPLYEDEMIHFRDVLLAMTRELVKEVRDCVDMHVCSRLTCDLFLFE